MASVPFGVMVTAPGPAVWVQVKMLSPSARSVAVTRSVVQLAVTSTVGSSAAADAMLLKTNGDDGVGSASMASSTACASSTVPPVRYRWAKATTSGSGVTKVEEPSYKTSPFSRFS
ncbi:hypothetical protein Hhel01_04286 [Haloferula helveola]